MRRSSLAVVCLMCGVAGAAIDVVVTKPDGTSIEGSWEIDTLAIKTRFGSATVDASRLNSIDFGKTVAVLTDDGTVLRGDLALAGITIVGERSVTLTPEGLKSLVVIRRAEMKPGETTSGIAKNRMSYHLRAPEAYDPSRECPAILILHGSNMNSKSYVATIASAWPELARDYLLIGIDGEQRNAQSQPDNPSFNYTYVNYVGRSTYKGYPGTDRESPALVPEVLAEIRNHVKISKVFVGGHSQGGFLTYSLMMNTPELFAGAFPISSGLIMQAEPRAFDKIELIARQKRVPLAIVHASNDGVVNFGMSEWARGSFDDAGFPMVRLFDDERAGHMFARLPVERAVRWLETMSSDDPGTLLDAADRWSRESRERDAAAALDRFAGLPSDDSLRSRAAEVRARVEAAAEEASRALPSSDADPAAWVDAVISFRARFLGARACGAVLERFGALRVAQQPLADELYAKAERAYAAGRKEEGRALAERILKECPASDKRRIVKAWLE